MHPRSAMVPTLPAMPCHGMWHGEHSWDLPHPDAQPPHDGLRYHRAPLETGYRGPQDMYGMPPPEPMMQRHEVWPPFRGRVQTSVGDSCPTWLPSESNTTQPPNCAKCSAEQTLNTGHNSNPELLPRGDEYQPGLTPRQPSTVNHQQLKANSVACELLSGQSQSVARSSKCTH